MARRTAAAAVLLVVLKLAATTAVIAQTQPLCRTYESKGLIQPATGSLQDVIVVQASALTCGCACRITR